MLNESLKRNNVPQLLPESRPNTAMYKYSMQRAPTMNGAQDAVPLQKANGNGKYRVPIEKRSVF